MRRVWKRSLLLAGACAVLLAPMAAADVPSIIRIGILTDMSGSTSDASGQGSVVAARLAVADHGGRAAGVPVEVVAADHLYKADVASSIARRWLDQDGVSAIVDLPLTQVALAAVEIARQRDRAVLIASAASSDLTGRACSPVSTHWTDDTYALAYGTARALTRAGRQTWFFLTADYAFGHALQRDATVAIQAEGGKVLGAVRHPLQGPDVASFLIQAASSGAQVIGLANVGGDTINAIKQAAEFGIDRKKQNLAGLLVFINDVHALGLQAAQGLIVTSGFYWDNNDASRAFSERFRAQIGRMPAKPQAAVYAAVRHWLKAVDAAKGISGTATTRAMRDIPIDYFGQVASLRPDGRVLYDLKLFEVKAPGESRGPWDYYRPIAELNRSEGFRRLADGGCPHLKEKEQ